MGQRTETYTCLGCNTSATRPIVRGQRPKWCSDCRAQALRETQCAGCGATVVLKTGARYCSLSCRPKRQPKPKPPKQLALTLPVDRRSPLRRAIEDDDLQATIAAVRLDTVENERGCWIWQRKIKDGYAQVQIAGRTYAVHRIVMGNPDCAVVHHQCADRRCVNPEHLQLVTHRENVAEMLERNHYLQRIERLEEALATLDPSHPLLPRGVPRERPYGAVGSPGTELEFAL